VKGKYEGRLRCRHGFVFSLNAGTRGEKSSSTLTIVVGPTTPKSTKIMALLMLLFHYTSAFWHFFLGVKEREEVLWWVPSQ